MVFRIVWRMHCVGSKVTHQLEPLESTLFISLTKRSRCWRLSLPHRAFGNPNTRIGVGVGKY